MRPTIRNIETMEADHPIALLHRKKLEGEHMLWALVHLEKGCHVAPHSHVSEQIAYVISGRARWTFGNPGEANYSTQETSTGDVILLPSMLVHSVEVLEDTHVLDVLSPPGAMGVDNQENTA